MSAPVRAISGSLLRCMGLFVSVLVVASFTEALTAGGRHGSGILAQNGFAFLAPALADDDGDDDDYDDRPARLQVPVLELVVVARGAGEIDRIIGQGYAIVARGRLGILGAEIARVRTPRGVSFARARARIAALIPTAIIDLNHFYRPDSLRCDDKGCASFGMIGWKPGIPVCDVAAKIGLVDTGIDRAHPAFRRSSIEHFDVRAKERRPSSTDHGTAVAALLVGDPEGPAPGLLPRAHLIVADAFHRSTDGGDAADAFDLVNAISAVVEHGAEIVNMSFSGPRNAALEALLDEARRRGVGLVAAVGHARREPGADFPAAHPTVIGVTAIDAEHRVYRRAVSGPQVDFAAPGVALATAGRGRSGTRLRSGTSFAAPFVTAVLAAVRARGNHSADNALSEMARQAVDLGAPGRDERYGWGLVRAPEFCAVAPR
jgi:subtilisin family serine protease